MGNVGRRRARCKFSLSYLAWRSANLESASPSEDEGPCRAKSRQRGYPVLAPLERAPRLRSGIRSIESILGALCQLTTPYPTSFLAQPHEPHASLAAEARPAALGLHRAGAVEIGNAELVALDDHAQPAAVGFGEFVARRGYAIEDRRSTRLNSS